MNKFEKVSFQEFCKGSKLEEFVFLPNTQIALPNPESLRIYENIIMPQRKTYKSAGYDIHSPFDFTLQPNDSIKIATGLKVYLDDGLWLMGIPRSSLGFGFYMQLNNTVMAIDGDYVDNPDNEGHIFIKITNCGDNVLEIKAGDGFVQTMITQYFITTDDNPKGKRVGGVGSTNS